ncbi:uncharacterized protein [Zea mays]|uniref:FK506-binding protein 2-1 n=1 Tax=Zea mays TaxID=4577 RepID=A0A1D6KJP7_MAIZE|nr:uncharacterized protein LOC103642659 isoform X4 [Zea mays]ONM03154.1 FK506-binding protein 2-1 [Zea mays]|eukprot:XP_008664118.1 uncharacterized protein LOC103642659 isoform X4 [Zea mays]
MESAHKSGGGSAPGAGAGGEGVLCHACGYQYPNGHPSAKQRRAHRKHCGKPASAAAAAEGSGEHEASELLLGEVGAGAAECGGGSPGSAHEHGDAAEGGDSAGNGAGHRVVGDTSAEDCLISGSSVLSEITSESSRTDDGTLTTVATQYSEKGSSTEDGDPSDPAVGSEQIQDVPTSVVPAEPEDRAKFSSEISESEIQNPSIVRPESDAAGGGTSELTDDVARQQDEVAVTGEDAVFDAIDGSKSSERNSVQGDELNLSCQDILQTETGGGHSSTVVEEDSGSKDPTASDGQEILIEETEPNQQSKHALTGSFEKVPDIESVGSSAEKSVGTGDDLLQSGKGACHSEIPVDIIAQLQLDPTSGTADHPAISKGADNFEGQHYHTTDESIGAIPSTFEPAVGAKVVSVDVTADLTEDVCSSDITIDDGMQENVTSGTIVPSQVDILDSSPSATAHEVNIVGSINDDDEKSQDGKSSADLASYEVKEMVVKDNFEEKQQTKEVIVDPTPHEANNFPSTDNHEENEQNKEIVADTTSHKISAVQSMGSTEEKEHIEDFIAKLASEEIIFTSNRDIVEQQDETDMKTNYEIDRARNLEATEEIAAGGESNTGTITDVVEDKFPNEEITLGTISLNMADSSVKEEKMHDEEVNEDLDSRDDIMVHGPDNVKEKMCEETMSGPTLDKFSLPTSTDSPEEGNKDESTRADPMSHETNVAQTSDGADEEKKIRELAVDPTSSIGTMGNIGNAEDKKPSEETTTDPRPVENTTTQGTEDATDPKPVENTTPQGTEDADSSKQNENTASVGGVEGKKQGEETTADPRSVENTTVEGKKQGEETTADPRSVENTTAQGTEDAESSKQNENTNVMEEERVTVEDTTSREISAIESTDDLKGKATNENEEIADKEMVTDSDKNHVSLKVLLADKNVEAKEKEKKATSAKDRVLSFRRRVSKDNVSPPVKPGSPTKDKDGSGQQDWNSPARLPVEKKPKGRKQQWVPFICCSSVQ